MKLIEENSSCDENDKENNNCQESKSILKKSSKNGE